MRRSPWTRLVVVVLVAGSSLAVGLAGPVAAGTVVKCTKQTAVTNLKTLTATFTFSGCTPISATGGSGKGVSNIKTSTAKITWAAGKGTTTVKETYKGGPKPNKCPPKTTLDIVTFTVTGGTGAALKAMPKGQRGTTDICLAANNSSTLEPGTVVTF